MVPMQWAVQSVFPITAFAVQLGAFAPSPTLLQMPTQWHLQSRPHQQTTPKAYFPTPQGRRRETPIGQGTLVTTWLFVTLSEAVNLVAERSPIFGAN